MVADKPKKPGKSARPGASTPNNAPARRSLPVHESGTATGAKGSPGGSSTPPAELSGRGTKSLNIGTSNPPFPRPNAAGNSASSATKGMDGVAGNLAGNAAQKAIEGKGDSATRRAAGRYAGAGVSGAVAGAQAGGVPGAVAGAAKNVAMEAGKDAAKGVSKITGGSPVAKPADKRLGAGGTGYERESKQDDGMGKTGAKAAAIGGSAAAAPPAMAAIMFMSLMAWLKSMFFAFMAMVANAGNAMAMFLLSMVKAAWSFLSAPFMALGGIVAKGVGAALGVTVSTTASTATALASGAMAAVIAVTLGGGIFASALDTSAAADDADQSDSTSCTVNSSDSSAKQVSANTEANAKVVFSVLSSWDMPEENIAGILGNWSQESGIDPTSVEGIFDEPYKIGPRKQEAWDDDFTHIPGQSHGGIGLGQWSNGRTPMLLDYADKKGVDWYTIEAQLSFMVEGDNPGDIKAFKKMVSQSQSSPSKAARYFHDNWERSADNEQKMSEREKDAEMWYGKMSGWTVDDSVVGDVEDIAGDVINGLDDGVAAVAANCDNEGEATNVGLVEGGMTENEAQELIDLYNKEGDKFLDEKYGENGGPGSCDDNHAMNCVSFSTYFLNKYTSFQKYPKGNGIQTAHTLADMTGKKLTSTPTPYSIGSGPGSGSAGHTLAVLGVKGDKVIVGEAGYCEFMGQVRVTTVSELQSAGWTFVDVSDLVGKDGSNPDGLVES